jgi:hypothetical protein
MGLLKHTHKSIPVFIKTSKGVQLICEYSIPPVESRKCVGWEEEENEIEIVCL